MSSAAPAPASSDTTTPRRGRRARLGLVAGVVVLVLAGVATWAYVDLFKPATTCQQQAGIDVICGFNNPEDMAQIGDTPWVLASDLGDKNWQDGGMSAYNSDTGSVVDVPIDFTTPMTAAYEGCPGPPDTTAFSAHGLSVQETDGTTTLLVVNHGGRESVEAFDVSLRGAAPTLAWKGCAIYPDGKVGNSVAAYGDNEFLATVPQDAGLSKGGVYAWAPGDGWNRKDNLEFEGNNGILVSPDNESVYIAEWSAGKVIKAPLTGDAPVVESDDLGFLPDNLRFAPDGSIYATGQDTSVVVIAGVCNTTSVEVCPAASSVTQLDPTTLAATPQLTLPRTKTFGGATSAIVVDDDMLVSSFRSDAILRIPTTELPLLRS
jgi:hypothetical protein